MMLLLVLFRSFNLPLKHLALSINKIAYLLAGLPIYCRPILSWLLTSLIFLLGLNLFLASFIFRAFFTLSMMLTKTFPDRFGQSLGVFLIIIFYVSWNGLIRKLLGFPKLK